MKPDLSVDIGAIRLRNPVICGSGEHVMTRTGISSALKAGAAAVVAKSTNESDAARAQLEKTDYMLLDSDWQPLPWNFDPPRDAHLFCRSGLTPRSAEGWLDDIASLDEQAAKNDQYVVASLILAELSNCKRLAQHAERAGVRVLELNIGAPHGEEAAAGAIALERSADRVKEITATIRDAVDIALWIKLTGQSENVSALARAARDGGADAVILMGRYMAMIPDLDSQRPMLDTAAGLGGVWALPLTCRWLAKTRDALGPDYPLLGTNGARTGGDVARFMLAGARAVEMGSAVWTGGFDVLGRAIEDLKIYLADHNQDATEIVGLAADSLQSYAEQESRPDHWQKFAPEGALDEPRG